MNGRFTQLNTNARRLLPSLRASFTIMAVLYLEHFTHRFHSVLSTESLNDPILQTPLGWYKPNGIRENKPRNHTPVMCARLVKALRCLIEQYPDVMTVPDVANLTGYHRESSSTVCCNR